MNRSMRLKSRLFLSILLLLFLLLHAGCDKKTIGAGDKAPDFILKDINGNDQRLSEMRGNVVVLEFWATWCHPCQKASADMVPFYEKYKKNGVVILAVATDENLSDVNLYAKGFNLTYPILFDDKGVNKLYKVQGIPTTFLISKKGKIISRHVGYMPGMFDSLSREIEAQI